MVGTAGFEPAYSRSQNPLPFRLAMSPVGDNCFLEDVFVNADLILLIAYFLELKEQKNSTLILIEHFLEPTN